MFHTDISKGTFSLLESDLMKRKIHPHMTLENSIDQFTCRWSHGWGSLECQCGLEFGHAGDCRCYDVTCTQTWRRPSV